MPSRRVQSLNTLEQEDIDMALRGLDQNERRSIAFGRYRQFIEEINLPSSIQVGDEYVSSTRPLLVLKRIIPTSLEIFQKPYFHIARKIRVRFHWDGLQVLGANMEEPNCFLMPIPVKANISSGWFLKLCCQSDCAPGKKALYVSIEILRENLLLRLLTGFAKVISYLSLLITIALPFLYFASKAIRTYVNNEIGFSGTGTISLAAVIIFSIFILSSRIEDVFPTLVSDQNLPPLVITDTNSKSIRDFVINVTKVRSGIN